MDITSYQELEQLTEHLEQLLDNQVEFSVQIVLS